MHEFIEVASAAQAAGAADKAYPSARGTSGLPDIKGPPPIAEILHGEQTHEDLVNGGSGDDSYGSDDSVYGRLAEDLMDRNIGDEIGVNWELAGERAGLHEDEIFILECRAEGLTRRQILQEVAENEQERLQLQAAYRRIYDHLPEIRAILLGYPPQKAKRRVHRR